MAETMRVSARAIAPVLAGRLSANRGGVVTIQIAGLDDPRNTWVAIGKSTGEPATYADFDNDIGGALPIVQGQTVVTPNFDTGSNDVKLTVEVTGSGLASGNQVYVAVFPLSGASPGPTDTPTSIFGPIDVIS